MSRIHQLYVSTFLLTLIPAAAYGGYGVLPGSGNNISNYSVSKISETSFRAGADRNGSFSAAADWNIILSDGVSRDGVRKIFLNAENEGAAYSLSENSGNSKIIPSLKTQGTLYSIPSLKTQGGVGEGFKPTLTQLAAACFVTDTTNCSGNEFGGNNADDNDGGVPPGGDDYDLDNDKRCIEEGYTQTSCPEGYEPYNYCPYDRTYFEKCVPSCPSDYVTCEEPYHGVGEACDGKYASCECTPCGLGYDNTTIPEGYVQDGEACLDCDGKTKYKIKPNPCDGYMDCGSMGPEAGAKTCLSGTTTMYDNCKACPNLGEYTTCPSCTICQYEECSGLWYATGCATNCTNYCNPPTTDCQALGYKRDTCTGRALKCPYDSAYVLCL